MSYLKKQISKIIFPSIFLVFLLLPSLVLLADESALEAEIQQALNSYRKATIDQKSSYLKLFLNKFLESRLVAVARVKLEIQNTRRIGGSDKEELISEADNLLATIKQKNKKVEEIGDLENLKKEVEDIYNLKIFAQALPSLYIKLIVARTNYELAKATLILGNLEQKLNTDEALKTNTLVIEKTNDAKALINETKQKTDSILLDLQKLAENKEKTATDLANLKTKVRELKINENRLLELLKVLAQILQKSNY